MFINIYYLLFNFWQNIIFLPNLSFIVEYFFLQYSFLFLILFIVFSEKIFMILLGFILLVFITTGFLVMLHFDVLAIIFLNTELIVVLVFILCGWSFTNDNNTNKKNLKNLNSILVSLVVLFNLFVVMTPGGISENYLCPLVDEISIFLENYYEFNNNNYRNSFNSYFYYFYVFNLLALIIIAIIVLVVSFICVIINSFFWEKKITNYSYFTTHFVQIKNFFYFLFWKKQNLTKQNLQKSSVRSFKKKNKQGVFVKK